MQKIGNVSIRAPSLLQFVCNYDGPVLGEICMETVRVILWKIHLFKRNITLQWTIVLVIRTKEPET